MPWLAVPVVPQGVADDPLGWLEPDVVARLTGAGMLHDDQIQNNIITM